MLTDLCYADKVYIAMTDIRKQSTITPNNEPSVRRLMFVNISQATDGSVFQTKKCSSCQETKPICCFYKNRTKKDGVGYECKTCVKIYQQSENSKIARRRYRQSDKAKKTIKKYMQSEKGEAKRKLWRQSEEGKITLKRAQSQWIKKYPERKKALNAVSSAVRRGELLRIKTLNCFQCGNQAEHYHHLNGHNLDSQLEVIPVCIPYHHEIEKERVIKHELR